MAGFCVYCNENRGSIKLVNVVSRLTTVSFLRIALLTDLVRYILKWTTFSVIRTLVLAKSVCCVTRAWRSASREEDNIEMNPTCKSYAGPPVMDSSGSGYGSVANTTINFGLHKKREIL